MDSNSDSETPLEPLSPPTSPPAPQREDLAQRKRERGDEDLVDGGSILGISHRDMQRLLEDRQFAVELLLSELDALARKLNFYRSRADGLAARQEDMRSRLVSQTKQLENFPPELKDAIKAEKGGSPELAELRALLVERTVYEEIQHKIRRRFKYVVKDHAALNALRGQDMRQPDVRTRVEAALNENAIVAKLSTIRQAVAEVEQGIRGAARRDIREHLYGVCVTFKNNPRGMIDSLGRNYLLMGPPGTGKSQVARVMARFFFAVGLHVTPNVFNISKSDLVAGFMGQSAPKTRAMLFTALEGVLFLDEAYSLLSCEYVTPNKPSSGVSKRENFGVESANELTLGMTDLKGKMSFICAGYEEDMRICFLGANSGLSRRFPNKWVLTRFSREDLADILQSQLERLDEAGNFWFQSGRQMFSSNIPGSRASDLVDSIKVLIFALDRLNAFEAQAGDMDIVAHDLYNAMALRGGALSDEELVELFNNFLIIAKNNTRYKINSIISATAVDFTLADGRTRVVTV